MALGRTHTGQPTRLALDLNCEALACVAAQERSVAEMKDGFKSGARSGHGRNCGAVKPAL